MSDTEPRSGRDTRSIAGPGPEAEGRSDSGLDPVEVLAEEFAGRYRRGERPSVAEYAALHPHLAERIRALFPALVVMEELGSVADPASTGSGPAGGGRGVPDRLGDYRILREVGRGGMGVVYEAVQESLGRHVALKVLPSHGLLSPTHLERFRREARAAAKLHHTNIVPVFGVGEHDGIHYYAMQFIRGRGLDEVLGELKRLRLRKDPPPPELSGAGAGPGAGLAGGLVIGRATPAGGGGSDRPSDADLAASGTGSPAGGDASGRAELTSQPEAQYFRSAARIAEQVATALDYAHGQGILHRDIKPSNLLLDAQGTAWVADFGLAKAEGTDELTHTGDIVGTLRYMAPERFHGWSDPRSDVYGVGVTLYELLTLRPAFRGSSRARLVERVLHDDPPRPRRVDSHIPRDLETIVLKAIAKEPTRRYPTAAALAEDLRRFAADRPILARRASWSEQAWRSCRRNPAIAGLAAAVVVLLALAVAVLAVSNLRVRREGHAKAIALREKSRALDRARQDERRARDEAAKAKAIAGLLDEMLFAANPDSFKGGGYTVLQLLEDFSQRFGDQLAGQPEVEVAIRMTMARAYSSMGLFEKEAQQLDIALGLRRRTFGDEHVAVASILDQYAWNLTYRRNYPEAEARAREALAIYRNRGGATGARDQALWALQRILAAENLRRRGRADEADGLVAEVRRECARRIIGDGRDLTTLNLLNRIVRILITDMSRSADAESIAEEALAIVRRGPVKESVTINSTLMALVTAKSEQGKYAEAEPLAREGLDMRLRLHGDKLPARSWAYFALGRALAGQGKDAEAEPHYREALAIFRKDYPPGSRGARLALWQILEILHRTGRLAEAARLAPGLDDAAALDQLARELVAGPDPAHRRPAWAVRLAGQAVALRPDDAAFVGTLGTAYYRAGDWRSAIETLKRADDLGRGAHFGYNAIYIAMARWQLGDKEEARKSYLAAVRWMRDHQPGDEELVRLSVEAAALLGPPGSSPEAEPDRGDPRL